MAIPIIDIFAGPGGLGEGFSSLRDRKGEQYFKISLSIEKDVYAHQTLTLRSFYRQFAPNSVPSEYYSFLKGEISCDALYNKFPLQSEAAKHEAWHATLGEGKDAVKYDVLDDRIEEALNGRKNWLLIGGPPCQAYSIVGRNRRGDTYLDESKDERVGLYKQYLRILAVHNPAVFVMENVKGLLSAETKDSPIFSKILSDLKNPVEAYLSEYRNGKQLKCPGYKIYSLVVKADLDSSGDPKLNQKDFVICTEKYGIPQTRHRVILLGVRRNLDIIPGVLNEVAEIGISKVLSDLPKLRGAISKSINSEENWKKNLSRLAYKGFLKKIDDDVSVEISEQLQKMRLPVHGIGAEFINKNTSPEYCSDWFSDPNLKGVCNHTARGHMLTDLQRYFYISCFAKVRGVSPQLADLPFELLPDHKNVFRKDGSVTHKFPDRFRVQLKNKPAKTITSHISQDGHYYIHYDPTQCRSFTVREAARIQTFPDNYFFCGPRTHQFIQVGNAVPPLLAFQIAKVVQKIFDKCSDEKSRNVTSAIATR